MNMNMQTLLNKNDQLPLTCSRSGDCCFGNQVHLNPWELHKLAKEKEISVAKFKEKFTEFGGLQLNFNGKINSKNKQACSLYDQNKGCTVHKSRPLACRLYPIGRQIQSGEIKYIYQGEKFPCLETCPDVEKLPKIKIEDYLKEQETSEYELAQDLYLEVMQNIADIAFSFYLDTKLAVSGDKITLENWRKIGKLSKNDLMNFIGKEWIDFLALPHSEDINEVTKFIEIQNENIQQKIQKDFENYKSLDEIRNASQLIMGIALFIAISIGANPDELSEFWSNLALNISKEKS